MDTILVAVTGLSLAMAGAMGALLVRMLRAERRRSDARVALLEQLAAPTVQHGPPPARRSLGEGGSNAVQHGDTRQLGTTPVVGDFELRPRGTGAVAEPEIFHEHEAPSAWPRRFAVVGVMAALLAAVVFGWNAMQSVPAGAAQVNQATARAGDQPLELLSLQYAQDDGVLVISGLVQNPRNGAALSGVEATVLLFAADGTMLSSGRSPLDFTTLSPGDESPFVIRVPVSGTVARYRVGFRGANDRVLGHVDRRNPDALARRQAP